MIINDWELSGREWRSKNASGCVLIETYHKKLHLKVLMVTRQHQCF